MEDAKIVQLYLQRDEEAIRFTAEKYGTRLQTVAERILDDRSSAEECVNDTYLAAWKSIPPHTPENYLFAFLARITRNAALDRLREGSRQKRSAQLVELTAEMAQCIPAAESVEGELDAKVLGGHISAFLRKQPEIRRNIFLRRYWYMDSVAEIAERFRLRESNVKSILMRTRNALRKYLEKEDYLL